jgi:FixJ family two-component response regulator
MRARNVGIGPPKLEAPSGSNCLQRQEASDISDEIHSAAEVFIVDDDAAICRMLSLALRRSGYQVACFADGASFVAAARIRTPACILLDLHIPGRSGLDILKDLNAKDYPAPILIISGHGDIPTAVDAIKHGALDFIEKPFRGSTVAARLRDVIAGRTRLRANNKVSNAFPLELAGHKSLTRREGEVLAQLVTGASSKEVGRQLGISPRTIDIHRAHIIGKLGAKNITDLVRIVMSESRA